jgi:hypothetical protein
MMEDVYASKTCVGGCLRAQELKRTGQGGAPNSQHFGLFYFGTLRSELELIPSGPGTRLRGLGALVSEKFAYERDESEWFLNTTKNVA